jgi:hypothetical protein
MKEMNWVGKRVGKMAECLAALKGKTMAGKMAD